MTDLKTMQPATLRGLLTTTVARAVRLDDRRTADPKAERRWKAKTETIAQLQALAAEFHSRAMVLELLEAHAGAQLLLNVNMDKRLTWHVIVMCLQVMRQEGK